MSTGGAVTDVCLVAGQQGRKLSKFGRFGMLTSLGDVTYVSSDPFIYLSATLVISVAHGTATVTCARDGPNQSDSRRA